MTPGSEKNLSDVMDARKTAVIDKELIRLKTDIADLQETGLADSSSKREEHLHFLPERKKMRMRPACMEWASL